MNVWGLVFIVVAIAMAVGPIMMFQPSQRDRRLAKLRQLAAQQGLKVRLAKQELLSGDKKVAVYSLPVKLSKAVPTATLVRQEYEHEVHFCKTWELQDNSQIPASYQASLKSYISALPESIVGLDISPSLLGVWWLESDKASNLDPVNQGLEGLKKIFA